MLILKITKNKALHTLQTENFLKYILKVKAWIFFNINFCRIINLSLHVNKNEFRKIVRKIAWGKV